jgi:nickel-type superoxide dismutase maturation protease
MHQLAVYTRVLGRLLPLRRFRVHDTSMQPALRPADRVLVACWSRVRVGDIVVLRDPEAPSTFLAKRVFAVCATGDVEVRGDNPNVSRDSRHFGAVRRGLIVGRVVYRYLPPSRRGRL